MYSVEDKPYLKGKTAMDTPMFLYFGFIFLVRRVDLMNKLHDKMVSRRTTKIDMTCGNRLSDNSNQNNHDEMLQ